MQYIYGFENFHSTKPSAISFGKFDGLHRGHQLLIGYVKAYGQGDQMNSIVCSIDKDPDVVLMTKDEQKFKLKTQVDYLVTCPFSDEFRHIPAEAFIRDIIKGVFHAEYVVVGSDFRFGYRAEGSAWLLKQLADKYNYKVVVVEKKMFRGERISSTLIRNSLRHGEIEAANTMLGYN
ncbi:MAG: riboflavin biosynthesis protein RibF, partial [Dorea sp.]